MLNKQLGFFQDTFIANTRDKLAELYNNNPDIAQSEKKCLLEYWSLYEDLSQILADKWSDFADWFMRATSPETITRCLRALKEDGTIAQSPEKAQRRQEREQEYRQFWGNEKRLRDNNG